MKQFRLTSYNKKIMIQTKKLLGWFPLTIFDNEDYQLNCYDFMESDPVFQSGPAFKIALFKSKRAAIEWLDLEYKKYLLIEKWSVRGLNVHVS